MKTRAAIAAATVIPEKTAYARRSRRFAVSPGWRRRGHLLPVSRDHQQRVIDGETEAEAGGDKLSAKTEVSTKAT
jgi:hypothetical protein